MKPFIGIEDDLAGTALQTAVSLQQTNTVAFLLSAGYPPDEPNDSNFTALHWAAYHGDKGIIELLLKHKAGVNLREKRGATPYDIANRHGHTHLLPLLIGKTDSNPE